MKLQTLGELKLEGSAFTRPKPLLLLSYLQIEGAKSRREVAEMFWPGNTDALKNLRVIMAQVNKDAPAAIKADGQKIWTELPGDALELQEALMGDWFSRVIELYKGPFLAGISFSDIGEELEEWIFKTRERFAHQVRMTFLTLARQEVSKGDFKEAASYTEKAYFLRSAPEPDSETLERMYTLLKAGENQQAESVIKEAKNYGLDLAMTADEAKTKLQNLQPHSNASPLKNIQSLTQDIQVTEEAIDVNKQGTQQTQYRLPLFFLSGLIVLLLSGLAYLLLTASFKPQAQKRLGVDDVDVALNTYFFCSNHHSLYLSSSYAAQSTAIRFRDVVIPKPTLRKSITISSATLTFIASNSLEVVPTKSGFGIRGIFDSSPWLIPQSEKCQPEPLEAQNYINRVRTQHSETYYPDAWMAGQTYMIDVTNIVQEIVNNPEWTGDAIAFAIDKIETSSVDLNVYSFDRAETDGDIDKSPKLSVNFTIQDSP